MMMNNHISELLKNAETAQGNEEINNLLAEINKLLKDHHNHIQLLHTRARLYFKLDKMGHAINDYKTILSINKDDSFAASQVENLKTILRFRNTDIFENPNTTFDPWLE